MEEERHYNEIVMSGGNIRNRTVSSPVPYNPSPSSSRPLSPGNYCNILVLCLSNIFYFYDLILFFHVRFTYIYIYIYIFINISIGSSTREGFNTNRCYACGQPTTIPFASSSPPSGVSYILERFSNINIKFSINIK